MKPIDFFEEIPQTYITSKYKGKDREMRRFGAVTFTDKHGHTKELRPAEYLYIYRDGKHKVSYSKHPFRSTGNKEKK